MTIVAHPPPDDPATARPTARTAVLVAVVVAVIAAVVVLVSRVVDEGHAAPEMTAMNLAGAAQVSAVVPDDVDGAIWAASVPPELVGAPPAASAALAAHTDGSFRVRFSETSPVTEENFPIVFVADASRCGPPPELPDSPCVVPVIHAAGFDSTFEGAVEGTVASESGAGVTAFIATDTPPGFSIPYVNMSEVVGSVRRCGTGSFLFRVEGNLDSPDIRWEVVPRSGTGELATLSGQGRATAHDLGHVSFTGRMDCGGNA